MTPGRGGWLLGLLACWLTLTGCRECASHDDCPEGARCAEFTSPLVTGCVYDAEVSDIEVPPCEGDGGLVEEACNGLDDDCDGQADEMPEGGFSCYPAAPDTLGIGVCRAGSSTMCVDGMIEACEGAVLPSDELCNGLDDDCDGLTDEPPPDGFPCYPYGEGLDDPTMGQGVCRSGTAACVGGVLGDCVGAVVPGEEQCNGLDDDCDGAVGPDGSDDGLQRACETGAECADVSAGAQPADDARCCFGVQTCAQDDQGVWDWTPCLGGNAQGQRVGEVCNGTDDDCDGVADEGTEEADPPTENRDLAQQMAQVGFDCVSLGLPGEVEGADAPTLGACRRFGRVACDRESRVVRCTAAAAAPGAERCDETPLPDGLYMPEMDRPRVPNFPEDARIEHRDEDCDGTVDELEDGSIRVMGAFTADTLRVGEACTAGMGECANTGTLVCGATGDTASCDAVATLSADETCNQMDDDCDGQIDEAVDANGMGMPLTRPCGTNLGACRAGIETCAMGRFGGCTAMQSPTPGVDWCDGLNNDCDGSPGPGDPMSDSDGVTDESCSCVGVNGAAIPPIESDSIDVRTAPVGADRANALRGTCGGGEARDIALAFTAPSAGLWRFRARGRDGNMRDPVVYVTSVCASASIEPGLRNEGNEQACADDDGAIIDPANGLEPAGRLGASAVMPVDADAELTVVVDGFGADDEGQWRLDTRRIDVHIGPGGQDERRKHVMLEGPSRARALQPSSQCRRRRVNLNKPDGPATLDDNLQVFCADNDGIYRALQLDGDGMDPVDGALGPGQVARVQGRLLPREVDEADWFSVKLAGAGSERSVSLRLWPPDRRPGPLRETFAADRSQCLGRWTRLVAYVACTGGAPADVGGGACGRDGLTQHLLCAGDELACQQGILPVPRDAGRTMTLAFAPDPCPAAGELVLFVGVLRVAEQDGDCVCRFAQGPEDLSDRSVTYELTIDYR